MRFSSLALALGILAAACGPPEASCERAPGAICTFAGTGKAGLGAEREPATQTELYLPQDVATGPDGNIYLVDWNNHRIRVVEADGRTRTVIGSGELGDAPDGSALDVPLNHPTHVVFDGMGRLVLSAWHNSRVMRMEPSTGMLESICGTGKRGFGGDGGPASAAILDLPVNTAFANDGSMYISDQANQRIRKVGPDDIIRTVVGSGQVGFGGDGGPATEAMLQAPMGQAASPSGKIAVASDGTLFIADSGNNRVRKVGADGIIHTIAGTGGAGYSGDGGRATDAMLSRPTDLALDASGNLYIADTDNSCIRKVDTEGAITTFAGRCGDPGSAGDGERAVNAQLSRPFGLEVAPDGTLYIADTFNHRVRVVYP
jgi:sugar lactone lactonase YvrE